jgi:hypothetical protein
MHELPGPVTFPRSMQSFYEACYVGDLQGAKSLYDLRGVDIHAAGDHAFSRPSAVKSTKVVVRRNRSGVLDRVSLSLSKRHFCLCAMQSFFDACKCGDYERAKCLYDLGGVDIHTGYDLAFRLACEHGRLVVAQWLHALGGVDIHAENDEALRLACRNGHLAVAQWLFSLGGVDIHADNDLAFRLACESGHLGVAHWLLGLGGVDVHAAFDGAFRHACEKGHLVVAKWLVGLGGVDIHAGKDDAFELACWCGHLGLARWLFALDPSWNWSVKDMWVLQAWSKPRDAWMRAVVH